MTLCNKYHIVINAVITVTIFLTFFLLSLIRPTNSNILRGQVGHVKERNEPRRGEATGKTHDLSQTTQILYLVAQKVHLGMEKAEIFGQTYNKDAPTFDKVSM